MPLRQLLKKGRHDRFERFNIVVSILLAGWVPSILTVWFSYTFLTKMMESRILRDRQTFVQLIGRLIGDDLSRTEGVIEYYQTLPEVARLLNSSNPQSAAQQWVSDTFYSHPRIDGMFVTSRDGRLIASIPHDPAMVGKDFDSSSWRPQAERISGAFVSPVHSRFTDKRVVTDVVGAVQTPEKKIVGYLGVSVLVERIGRRLSAIQFADQSTCQVVDQSGNALFTNDFRPNPVPSPEPESILPSEIFKTKRGNLERDGNLYSFSPVESTEWTVVVKQPKDVAYKPVHDLVGRMAVLAAWLMALTTIFAWLGGIFYRRQTEAARRIEREVIFNEKILANMPVGIAFIDPNTKKFTQANEAFTQMAERFGGFPKRREVIGSTYDDVKIAAPDAIERVLEFGTPFQLIEQPFQDEGGMTHFVNVTLVRLQAADETIQGVLYFVEDKTRDVTLRHELISANTAKDQFLALLSHELRNPLSPVIAMVGELEASGPRSPKWREALEVIRRNVELEARLIDDLLDVTRIAKGKLQLTFELVDVHEILRRAYEICHEDMARKKINARFELTAEEAYVEGDPARLQQVFWNLVKNSVKFTPEGGRITMATSNVADDEIEIRITDTGIGIESDKIEKIFKAFEQGQTSITRRFGGLGLGLAISKAMVDAHRGRIRVESPGKDQGATFIVDLKTVPAPVAAENGAEAGSRDADEAPGISRRRRLLVVDDHADTCKGMKMMLERRGYDITVAHSAGQAVEKTREADFDLLISDIGLPDKSGYELMNELRKSKPLPGIALSGFGAEADVNKARESGFSEHLTKPINFDRLEEIIRRLLKSTS
ncbi:MAG TPA: ATP-binding protein [Chthoniobacterales bacterium]|jgi:signal transduction histidine kinase/CheY-like chemotaxis protein|nr:ATP-binding protein [Chthoniobacterales bacterium]